jgi:hypothetical protein
MNASLENVHWEACQSAYRLDRFRQKELPPTESADVEAHLQGCARCRAATDALATEEANFRASAAPWRKPLRPFRPRAAWGIGAVALAAACLLALHPAVGVRSKGAPATVGMYVQHGQSVRRALPGETVAPGDSVRFTYSSRAATFLAILSVDGAGVANVYFPEGQQTAPLPAAEEALLPLATRLDSVLGEEQVVAVFCQRPRALEPLRQALQASPAAFPEVPGCTLAALRFTKRAP